jgi:uncharacterized repeat protein (TIGR01451 family)
MRSSRGMCCQPCSDLVMGIGRNVDAEVRVVKLTRLILYAMAIGGALVLLCACAGQEQPTATPAGTRLSARTAVPTRILVSASSPSPPPSVEPVGEPLRYAQTISSPGRAAADLTIQALPTETGIYTLIVRNLGPDLATGIVLTDVLPSGVTPIWTEPAQPVCGRQGRDAGCDLGTLQAGDAATVTLDLSAGGSETLITGTQLAGVAVTLSVPTCAIDRESSPARVTCRLSRLPPGAGAPMRVGIRVDDPATGALVHTATVAAREADPDPSNNRATLTLTAGVGEPAPSAAEGPIVATAVPTTTDLVVVHLLPARRGQRPDGYLYAAHHRLWPAAHDREPRSAHAGLAHLHRAERENVAPHPPV